MLVYRRKRNLHVLQDKLDHSLEFISRIIYLKLIIYTDTYKNTNIYIFHLTSLWQALFFAPCTSSNISVLVPRVRLLPLTTFNETIIFTLFLCRYNMASNRWEKESSVPRKAPYKSSFGFVVLNGELHVMTTVNGIDSTETRRSRQHKRAGTLFIQIYHPRKKTWRCLVTRPPFQQRLDFSTTVMCTILLQM